MGAHSPRALIVLHSSVDLLERVRAAASPDFEVSHASDWSSLVDQLACAPATAAVLIEGEALTGRGSSLLALIAQHPLVAVIVTVQRAHLDRDWLIQLPRGLSGMVVTGHDDTVAALRGRLRQARLRPVLRLVESTLPVRLPGVARALVLAFAEAAADGETAKQVASRLDVSIRALTRWCSDAGLPAPRRLLLIMRLLIASALLESRGRSVHTVARAAGYRSHTALGRSTATLLGLTLTQLQQRGPTRVVRKAILRILGDR